MTHVGIDFGARQAGTSVCVYRDQDEWKILQSARKQDADEFLAGIIGNIRPMHIYIDAPLSLPSVYKEPAPDVGHDFHYRLCDRETGAMSPMFLGGLTARAIRLRTIWEKAGITVHESYPARLVKVLGKGEYYKSDIGRFTEEVSEYFQMQVPLLKNWHQADAFLAWLSGMRHLNGQAESYGRPEEGLIVV